MDDELKQALAAMEARIDVKMEALTEQMRDTETKLLGAFYGWARPIESRIKQLPALDERVGWIEERESAVGRKLLEKRL